MDEIEFIEVDGLKIRFQRNKVGEGIPVVLTNPWPESLVVGSGATDTALTAGVLKDIINAPSTAPFEGGSGDVFATGTIDRMMKSKPDPQALKDYQASSAGRRFIEAMAYVRAYPIDLPSLRAALPGSEYLGCA